MKVSQWNVDIKQHLTILTGFKTVPIVCAGLTRELKKTGVFSMDKRTFSFSCSSRSTAIKLLKGSNGRKKCFYLQEAILSSFSLFKSSIRDEYHKLINKGWIKRIHTGL